MASLDENENVAYYLRFHLLIMEAQKVLRAKFDSIIKPADLNTTLIRLKGILDKLKKRGIISDEQYTLLTLNPKSETFDTTLLLCLFRNICNLNPKDKVWTEKDNTKLMGNTDQENIQRIRNLRNEMQHKNDASLEQQEFESSWNILEKAMVNIGTSCGMHDVQNTIKTMHTNTLEIVTPEMKTLREQAMRILKQYQEDEMGFLDDYDDYGEDYDPSDHQDVDCDIDCDAYEHDDDVDIDYDPTDHHDVDIDYDPTDHHDVDIDYDPTDHHDVDIDYDPTDHHDVDIDYDPTDHHDVDCDIDYDAYQQDDDGGLENDY